MRPINKRGQQLNFLVASIIALVVAGIVLVLGLVITQEIRDTDALSIDESRAGCNATTDWACTAYSAANNTVVGLGTFADFWEIIVLAIVAAVVVGIVLLSFARRTR